MAVLMSVVPEEVVEPNVIPPLEFAYNSVKSVLAKLKVKGKGIVHPLVSREFATVA